MMLNRQSSLLLLGSSLAIGISTDVLFQQDIFGLNFLLWTVLWSGILSVSLFRRNKLNTLTISYILFAVANAIMVYVRAEPVVQVWSVLSTLTFIALLFATSYLDNFFELSFVRRVVEYIGGSIISFIQILAAIVKSLSSKVEGKQRKTLAIPGIVVGTALVAIFIGLFSSSDQVFRQNFTWLGDALAPLGDWFNNFNPGRLFTTMFWSFVALGWLGMVISRNRVNDTSEVKLPRLLSARDTKVILGSVCAVFAVFVFVQLRFLFGGATLPDGITYADYARSGYGQLLLATVLASGVVYVTKNATKDGVSRQYNWLPILLLVLNAMVVVSAWKRLSLYESAYGWTMTRFVARMGLVCIMAGIFYLRIWISGSFTNKRLFAISWYTLAVVLLGVAILNPIGLITRRNIVDLPSRETALDLTYISELSADSYGSVCKYAPSLKTTYSENYKSLVTISQFFDRTKFLDQQSVPLNEQSLYRNHGLSAHYTSSESFGDKYYNCLK
ncbi:MAG: DUF4173 domain-containing protein [Patescibacteria group bacterium]